MTRPSGRRAPAACRSPRSCRARASLPALSRHWREAACRVPEESVTEGLDGLRDRLAAYHEMGARFAKWRGVIRISDALPSHACVSANAHALARYASLCQEQHLVPIFDPEVLMHTIERSEVTGTALRAVFDALFEQGVSLESMLLKPSMVIAGKECPRQPSAVFGRIR